MKVTVEVVHTNTHLPRLFGLFQGHQFGCSKILKSYQQKSKSGKGEFQALGKNKTYTHHNSHKMQPLHIATPTNCNPQIQYFLHPAILTYYNPYTLQPSYPATFTLHYSHTLQPVYFVTPTICNSHIPQPQHSATPTCCGPLFL